MKYRDPDLGYSFDLPEGWQQDTQSLFPSFRRDAARIQVRVGDAADPKFADSKERERFLMEPGCVCIKDRALGGEPNTVIVDHETRGDGVISTYRDGFLYSISYDNLGQQEVRLAIAAILGSFQFPSPAQAQEAMRAVHASPAGRALSAVLHADSPEDARRRLAQAGMPPGITRPGYSIHSVPPGPDQNEAKSGKQRRGHGWRFWRRRE